MDEHERAVALALATGEELRKLFRALGAANPRGRLMTAYRQARRALAGNVGNVGVVADVLRELRISIEEVTRAQLQAAVERGQWQARNELALYGLPHVVEPYQVGVPLSAVMAAVDGQLAQVQGLAQLGDEALILGDEQRVGALAPGTVLREATRWTAVAALVAYTTAVDRSVRQVDAQEEFMRQAIAAIDRRTTNCCLLVNGQTVPLDKPFRLSGTPRFADLMMNSPFHHFCRTSHALVRKSAANDDITQKLQRDAERELKRREIEGEGEQPTRRRSSRPSASTGTLTPEQLLYQWVHGSKRRTSIILKQAVKDELGVRGLIFQTRKFNIADGDISAARPAVREMYQKTQSHLREQGVKEIKLYRGVKTDVRTPGVVESWTTDLPTARKFDGHDVMEETIPASRIFMFSRGPGWKNGKYGEQYEYIVLGSEPR